MGTLLGVYTGTPNCPLIDKLGLSWFSIYPHEV